MTNTITYLGVTWTFATPVDSGNFINGDPWVVGPVVITNISPKTASATDFSNGSMLNPIPGVSQGLYMNGDIPNSDPKYDPAKNISLLLPYTVPVNNSVVSTVNNPDTWASPTSVEKTWFKEVSVLTVLASRPTARAFRPAYTGTTKTIFDSDIIDWSVLKNLTPPNAANVPNKTWLENATKRPLLEMHYNYVNSNWKASWEETKAGGYPRRTYGREISHISSEAALLLNTNLSKIDKNTLLINMVQWGIDVYGLLQAGMQFQPNGGHNHGRLIPLYIAAKVLNNADMLSYCDASKGQFQEFAQHWIVSQADIDTPRAATTIQPYTAANLGMAEWNSGGPWERNKASSDWNATGYRFINGAPNCGLVATIILMGGRNEVKCEPLYRYIIERYYPSAKGGAGGVLPNYSDTPSLFVRDMWETYIDKTGTIPVTPTTSTTVAPVVNVPVDNFKIGDLVQAFKDVNVRETPSLTGKMIIRESATATGTIIDGPIIADNFKWWKIQFVDNIGWSGGDNFNSYTPPTTSTTVAPTTSTTLPPKTTTTLPPVKPDPIRYINVLQSLDKGKTYTSLRMVPYPKVKGQSYKVVIETK